MNRMCDAGGICGHTPQCDHFCHFTNAENEPEVVRKIKPYPAIPDDIAPVPEAWQMVGSVVVGFVLVALVVIAALFFFTGLWIWSLLI
jgi:hypothetical protein